jgi:phage head maturation protease
MPKSKLKINSKYLDKLGLDVSADELPTDACIKRVNFDSTLASPLSYNSDIDVVEPHIIGNKKDEFSVGIITTIDVDSDGDVVLPKGIDTSRYEKNPVVLFQHNLNMPIGYAEEITVHDDKITAKTRYGSTEEAKKVHQLLKDKVLRTHSIGFVTLESEVRGTKAFELILNDLKSMFPDKFDEKTSKRVDRVVTKSLLLEYSVVTVPSNEEAVINEIKSIKDSKDKNKEVKEITDKIIANDKSQSHSEARVYSQARNSETRVSLKASNSEDKEEEKQGAQANAESRVYSQARNSASLEQTICQGSATCGCGLPHEVEEVKEPRKCVSPCSCGEGKCIWEGTKSTQGQESKEIEEIFKDDEDNEDDDEDVFEEIKENNEIKENKIKVIKRGSNIKKLSTQKEREEEKLKQAFMKLWGV